MFRSMTPSQDKKIGFVVDYNFERISKIVMPKNTKTQSVEILAQSILQQKSITINGDYKLKYSFVENVYDVTKRFMCSIKSIDDILRPIKKRKHLLHVFHSMCLCF